VFLDEAGFQIGSVAGTTWGLCGRTPVLPCHGRGWGKVNAAAGLIVSPGVRRHPRLCFRLFEANINGALFALFVRDLLREVRGEIIFIWDGWSAHKGPEVRALLKDNPRASDRLLPEYAPELNPVEGVWCHNKQVGLRGFVAKDTDDLYLETGAALRQAADSQQVLRGCVKETPLRIVGVT